MLYIFIIRIKFLFYDIFVAMEKIKKFLQENNISYEKIEKKKNIFWTSFDIKIKSDTSVRDWLLNDEKRKQYTDEKELIRKLELALRKLTDYKYSIYFYSL